MFLAEEEEEEKLEGEPEESLQPELSGDSDENLAKIAASVNKVNIFYIVNFTILNYKQIFVFKKFLI